MKRAGIIAMILILAGFAGRSDAARPWRLVVPDTVTVEGAKVTVGDLGTGPVPAAAVGVVLHAGGRPGTAVTIRRQGILRRLMQAGAAGGVRLAGAEECVLVFAGRELGAEALRREIGSLVQPLVPAANPGAPDSWFELEVADVRLAARGAWQVELVKPEPLRPGRNLLQVRVGDGGRTTAVPVTAILHTYGEVAETRQALRRDEPLIADLFRWTWTDLADADPAWTVGRDAVAGCSAARSLAAGARLRRSDLKITPVVRAGDAVELRIARGGVAVSVRGYARQDGCAGQTIPVRNDLTGRLVNARVAGPGLVEWRR